MWTSLFAPCGVLAKISCNSTSCSRSLLRGCLSYGRDMVWPRPGSLSAMCRLETAMCPPCVRLLSAMCPLCVRHAPALCPLGCTSKPFPLCPPSAVCPPKCPHFSELVRHVSGPRRRTLSAMCAMLWSETCVLHVSAFPAPSCARLNAHAPAMCPPSVWRVPSVSLVAATCLPDAICYGRTSAPYVSVFYPPCHLLGVSTIHMTEFKRKRFAMEKYDKVTQTVMRP